jgi:lipopolysaccharide transport system ATP-binding protein
MSDVVIRAEGLGKKYLIGHEAQQGTDVTFRDTIMRNVGRLMRSAGDLVRGRPLIVGDEVEEFWAFKDVNFEIRRGEVVGIIGRNGAGKSTLLKVLSRITEPTKGHVTIEGRVASLLEVGTGFHPELSGRENIFLNGSILGMTRKEIQAKFDEIVDFAGVEKFLDTPVKRYSSGMKVRLGFSVAAHLEPEILIVDEVLAVGDAEFQRKCLGKMQSVAGLGRTVLFVSHNMTAVNSLCESAILLKGGQLVYQGTVKKALSEYLVGTEGETSTELIYKMLKEAPRDPDFRFEELRIEQDGGQRTPLSATKPFKIKIKYRVKTPRTGLRVFMDFYDQVGTLIFRTFSDERGSQQYVWESGGFVSEVFVPAELFQIGSYTLVLRAAIYKDRTIAGYDTFDGPGIPIRFEISGPSSINVAYPASSPVGILMSNASWKTTKVGESDA